MLNHPDSGRIGILEAHGAGNLLFGDFAILFIESATLFAMANSVRRPERFAVAEIILLAADVIWVTIFTRRTLGFWRP